jgi:hypothetical protein
MPSHASHPVVHRRAAAVLRPRWLRRLGGSEGNRVLTRVNAALLLGLLAAQGVTVLALDSLIELHLFIGVVLVGPVALKLAATGYRFVRYYAGTPAYREAGPPRTLLRAIAPVFVIATIGLLASGVAMLLDGEASDGLLTIHQTSFWVWLGCLAVHVLFHATTIVRTARSDWRVFGQNVVPGAQLRATLVLASLAGGVLLALAVLSKITGWDA